jgi:hypothetical protein
MKIPQLIFATRCVILVTALQPLLGFLNMKKKDLLGKTVVYSRDGDTYIVTGVQVAGQPDRVRCTSSWCPLLTPVA